jgi:hypothetical protein
MDRDPSDDHFVFLVRQFAGEQFPLWNGVNGNVALEFRMDVGRLMLVRV